MRPAFRVEFKKNEIKNNACNSETILILPSSRPAISARKCTEPVVKHAFRIDITSFSVLHPKNDLWNNIRLTNWRTCNLAGGSYIRENGENFL